VGEDTTIEVLENWTDSGAVWKAVHVSDGLAIVDLCTCYGEPVDRIETRDAVTIAYVRDRLDDGRAAG
jgi:hypothetical protein